MVQYRNSSTVDLVTGFELEAMPQRLQGGQAPQDGSILEADSSSTSDNLKLISYPDIFSEGEAMRFTFSHPISVNANLITLHRANANNEAIGDALSLNISTNGAELIVRSTEKPVSNQRYVLDFPIGSFESNASVPLDLLNYSLVINGQPKTTPQNQAISTLIAKGRGKSIQLLAGVADTVIVASKRFKSGKADTIRDFNAEDDKIILGGKAFKKLKAISLAVISDKKQAKKLKTGRNTAPLIFNQLTGELIYDQNGIKKGLGKGGVFAKLEGETLPLLSESHFELG